MKAYDYKGGGEVVLSRRAEMHRKSLASQDKFSVAEPEGRASGCESAEDSANLCIQRLNAASNNAVDLAFGWDPSEPVATRPLILQKYGAYNLFYTHDGNKNVSELVFFQQANGIAAHYEYAPFGAVTATGRSTPVTAYDFRDYNPFRFSSECADDILGLVYYNYRHYNSQDGRWTSRDPMNDIELYIFVSNNALNRLDAFGLDEYINDVPEISPDLKIPYAFNPEELARFITVRSKNRAAHKRANQITPACPELQFVGTAVYKWDLRKRAPKTEYFDYPLFIQRFHIEFDVAKAFTIGGELSNSIWSFSGTKRVEKRDHLSILGLIQVYQRVVVKSYEWNCECTSSMYKGANGSFLYSWRRFYEEPTDYTVGKWLAVKMSKTSMKPGESWNVNGSLLGVGISYGEE